jgi:hypothetical protein
MERLELPSYIKPRREISAADEPFVKAIIGIIEAHKEYWPLSLRTVHYRLLSEIVIRTARTASQGANQRPSELERDRRHDAPGLCGARLAER